MKSTTRPPKLFTYDADGNMTSDGRFHYFWNGENRLICASNSEVVVTYAYDHRGRMVRKEISHRDTEPQRIEGLLKTFRVSKDVDCREALRIIEVAHGFGFTNFSLFFNENLPD